MNKKGDSQNTIVIQIILIALIMAMFLLSTAEKINGRGVRQDIIESQLAMFIDAAEQGMTFEIFKLNADGVIDNIKVDSNRIYVSVDGLKSSRGKQYFTPYEVRVKQEDNKFRVIIK